MLRSFLFMISLLGPLIAFSQQVKKPIRIDKIRIGIDPVRSLSMPFEEKNPDKHSTWYRTFEMNGEVVGPFRTSIAFEAGYTKAHLQPKQYTLNYFSEGWYTRLGLNLRLSEDNVRWESGIGWRTGISSFTEEATIRLHGDYWERERTSPMDGKEQFTIWGEVLYYFQTPLFPEGHALDNLYGGVSARLRLMPVYLKGGGYQSYNIPGFGKRNKAYGGVSFSLFYNIDINNKPVFQNR